MINYFDSECVLFLVGQMQSLFLMFFYKYSLFH